MSEQKDLEDTYSMSSKEELMKPSQSSLTTSNISSGEPEESKEESLETDNLTERVHVEVEQKKFLGNLFHNISYEMVFGIVTGFFAFILGFTAWGGSFVDLYTKVHGSSPTSEEVVVVNITPQSLQMWVGPSGDVAITPRGMLAQIIHFLNQAGAKTITLDIMLNTSHDGDEQLAKEIHRHGNVIASTQIVQNQPHDPTSLFASGTIPSIERDSGNNLQMMTGYANVYQEEPIFFGDTMVTRGVQPFQQIEYLSSVTTWPEVEPSERQILFPISLLTAMAHQGLDDSISIHDLTSSIAKEETNCSSELQRYLGVPICAHQAIWLLPSASEVQSTIPQVNAASILRSMATHEITRRLYLENNLETLSPFVVPEELKKIFVGKSVLIGRVDQFEYNFDRHTTTYSFPLFGNHDMAGVHLQAQYVDAFLSKRFIRFFPGWVEGLLSLLMALLSHRMYKRVSIQYHVPIFICITASLFALGCLLFSFGNFRVLELGGPITASLLMLIWMNVRWPTKE